ncbi:MAG: hypothetical protein IJ655_10230 [Lachnospiraceae bacterium]|nr:hypothetical protein [Lachnospiraceae bacterium]
MEENYTTPVSQPSQPSSMGQWFVTILLTLIPVVGLVMLFVWAFGNTADESKKNWAKANLIWMLIGIVLWFLIGATVLASIMALYGLA